MGSGKVVPVFSPCTDLLNGNVLSQMKGILILLLLIGVRAFSQVENGTATAGQGSPVQVSGVATINRIGFSPIPSFSFEHPLASIFLAIRAKKFSYEPAIFWGLNGKPWIIENWLKYRVADWRSGRISLGINPSLFFKAEKVLGEKDLIRANRNGTIGIFGEFEHSRNSGTRLTYWYNHAFDAGTISGHFIDLKTSFADISRGGKLLLGIRPELFYFNNTGRVDGFYGSAQLSLGWKDSRFSLYIQGVQPIWANFPEADFNWNAGIICAFGDK